LKELAESSIGIFVIPLGTNDSLATRASLLARLKHWEDHQSWQEFFDTYWRLIHQVARRSGLTETEAQDAVQETVLAVAKNIHHFKYDPARCSFKSWLMLITQQRIIWQLRRRMPDSPPSPKPDEGDPRTSTTDRLPDQNALDLKDVWEEEWQKNLLAAALDRVKHQVSPRQFQIFDLYVLRNWPAGEVARTLGVNLARVYLAKHRVSSRLSKEVGRLQRDR
jgi:RNA polymerase sigma-70 factor (ECF subfamily)